MGLYHELTDNPAFEGCFCTHPKEPHYKNNRSISKRHQVDALKAEFKPDLTIFRCWNITSPMANKNKKEIVWFYEKRVKLDSGGTTNGPCNHYPCALNAYQDLEVAKERQALWLPYCVSKYFEKRNPDKKYEALCITRIPTHGSGGVAKKRSADILLKPLFEHDLLKFYGKDYYGIPYLRKEGVLPSCDVVSEIAKTKIFISPTTIWHDPYALSHKTVSSMGCGVLTMTNHYGAIDEILGRHKETILYSNEPEDTLELVRYYLDHDKEREEIAMAGYEHVHKNYNWADHLIRLYDESTNL